MSKLAAFVRNRGKLPRIVKVILSVFFVGIAYVLFSLGASVYYAFSDSTVTFTANGWERVTRNGVSHYELYTDKGVFINVDSLVNWKHNSADVRSFVTVGKQYTCEVQGYRNRFFSMFPNVISCVEN